MDLSGEKVLTTEHQQKTAYSVIQSQTLVEKHGCDHSQITDRVSIPATDDGSGTLRHVSGEQQIRNWMYGQD